jgi:hypothetical protein
MHAPISRRQAIVLALILVIGIAGGTRLAAQAANVTGDWSFSVETGQGSGSPTITFKQDGESLTGTYNGMFGSAPIKGTVKGAAIEFSFEAEAQGQKIDNVYKGTVEKDTMKGTVAIAGGQLSGTFTGSRKK